MSEVVLFLTQICINGMAILRVVITTEIINICCIKLYNIKFF